MTDTLLQAIINNSKEINNLKQQRSVIDNVIDKFLLFFESIDYLEELALSINLNMDDTQALTDNLINPEYGTDFIDTVNHTGIYTGGDYFRLDYSRLDYGRLSHYKGGAESDVEVIVS